MSGYLDYEPEQIDYSSYVKQEEVATTGKTVDECLKPLKRGKFIGKGVFGSVIEACENGEQCDRYVAKIQKGNWESFIMLQVQLRINEGTLPQLMPKLIRSCKAGDREVIIMERMDGSLLSKGVATKKQIQDLIKEVSDLHKQHIVHQDLKFNNFLYKGKRVYLGDFGLAKLEGDKNQKLLDWLLLAVSLILNDLPLPESLIKKIKMGSRHRPKMVFSILSSLIREAIHLRKKKGLTPLLPELTPQVLAHRLQGLDALRYDSTGKSWDEVSEDLLIQMPGARGI